jgi:hypothetical protein
MIPRTVFRILLTVALAAAGLALAGTDEPAGPPPAVDPSGRWASATGELTLALAGDALSFTYTAVFGPSAHICDGAGVAGLVTDGRYEYVDEQGTLAFLVTAGGVRMETVSGIASFCGAHWPGDAFGRDKFQPLAPCRVAAEKSYFHVVGPLPPERRRGYVLQGDAVATAPALHAGSEWVLARFKGARGATVGLLRKKDLACP